MKSTASPSSMCVRHVVVQERERVVADVLDVGERAGVEIVDADHPVPLREQMLAQVRPEEARAAGDDGGRHAPHCRSGSRRYSRSEHNLYVSADRTDSRRRSDPGSMRALLLPIGGQAMTTEL